MGCDSQKLVKNALELPDMDDEGYFFGAFKFLLQSHEVFSLLSIRGFDWGIVPNLAEGKGWKLLKGAVAIKCRDFVVRGVVSFVVID